MADDNLGNGIATNEHNLGILEEMFPKTLEYDIGERGAFDRYPAYLEEIEFLTEGFAETIRTLFPMHGGILTIKKHGGADDERATAQAHLEQTVARLKALLDLF